MADDIVRWLEGLGLGQYAGNFADNDIDLSVLRHLTDRDFERLGVSLGHMRKLQAALAPDAASDVAAEAPVTPEAERRQLTVLFCDIVGSTALSTRLDPEDMRDVLRAYQDACAGVIARYDGYVAKFMGDGVFAYFGFPRAHEDDAERAINAGLGIVAAVGDLERDLQVRIGVATGTVAVGDIVGEGASEEAAIVGEAPNLAARLQEIAEPDTVVIGEVTHTLAGGLFETGDLGRRDFKGFADPFGAWTVVRPRRTETRFAATRGEHLTPLVGRDEEVEILRRRWATAMAGEGQVVLISGEPGIGKSRLVREIQEHAARHTHHQLNQQCSPYHTNSALYPIIQQMERAAGFDAADDADARLDKVEALLATAGRPAEDAAPLIASLLSVPGGERYPPLGISPQQQKERTLRALLGQLSGLARRRPVLFVVEDAHWIDPTTLELLTLTVDNVPELSVLMLITYRPEFEAPWVGQPHVTQLSLGRLGKRDSLALVERVAVDAELPVGLRDRIASQTDGVPLFVEELTKSVLETGGSAAEMAVPATLQDSLEARLDRLGPAKEIAQIGAVLGRSFAHGLIAPVALVGEDELRAVMDMVVASGLMTSRGEAPDATYTFKHALIQDTAYRSLLKGTRQRYHRRIAEVLADRFPDTAETQPELLAHHHTEAGQIEAAIPYWQEAGQRATQRSANVEAVAHLAKGLELLLTLPETSERPEQELNLRAAYGIPLIATRGYRAPEVDANYARAQELCELLGDPPELFPVLYGLYRFYSWGADWQRSSEITERLVRLADDSGDSAHLLEAHRAMGVDLLYRGDFAGGLAHSERSVAIFDPELHGSHAFQYGTDTRVYSLMFVGVSLLLLGHLDRAVEPVRESLEFARTGQHPYSLGFALGWAALFHRFRGDVARTREIAEELITVSIEHDLGIFLSIGKIFHGGSRTALGEPEAGLAELHEGLAEFEPTGAKLGRTHFLGWDGEALAAMGRTEEGLRRLDEALASVEDTGERLYEAELHRLKGAVLLTKSIPEASAAEACFRRSLDIARDQGGRLWELRAAVSLARLWHERGETALALDLLTPIHEGFIEGQDTADVQAAKALIDKLS